MRFEIDEDNRILVQRLERVVRDDRVSHAYILEGDHRIDKRAFTESFVKGILCPKHLGENCGECSICDKVDHGNCEDLFYVAADGNSIKDASILEVQDRLKTMPFGSRNVVIVEDADTMPQRAQNRLLKTLEEPPGNSVIFVLSENIENLVQTIQSRCVKYRLNYFGSSGTDSMLEEASEVVRLLQERAPFYVLKERCDKITRNREDTEAFLDSLQVVYRNLLLQRDGDISFLKDDEIAAGIHETETARKQIRQGVSPSYAIKNLMLKIGG